jgi:hypothetical protein
MRGNQEAYVLVKIKDGRKFVCALNKLKAGRKAAHTDKQGPSIDLEKDVLWQ